MKTFIYILVFLFISFFLFYLTLFSLNYYKEKDIHFSFKIKNYVYNLMKKEQENQEKIKEEQLKINLEKDIKERYLKDVCSKIEESLSELEKKECEEYKKNKEYHKHSFIYHPLYPMRKF